MPADGYLKYYNLAAKVPAQARLSVLTTSACADVSLQCMQHPGLIEQRQALLAQRIKAFVDGESNGHAPPPGDG